MTDLRTWLNTELTKEESEVFKEFLDENDIEYEASECYDNIHFEVNVSAYERIMIDEFISENF